jgi:hypothetical protein
MENMEGAGKGGAVERCIFLNRAVQDLMFALDGGIDISGIYECVTR